MSDVPRPSRRGLLLGAGGALAVLCGGTVVRLSTGYALGPGDVAIGLDDRQLAIVRAVVEALCPGEPGLPGGLELGVHQRIDEEVWSSPPAVRDPLRSAISAVELVPLTAGFGGRLSRLPVERRTEALAWMLADGPRPVCQAAGALKQMCGLFWYSHEATWAALGYDGPWVKVPAPPPSAVRYAALLAERRRAS